MERTDRDLLSVYSEKQVLQYCNSTTMLHLLQMKKVAARIAGIRGTSL